MSGQQMSRRVGEVAGNATAECAAVCCCVPCAVMDMVVLATYKVPAGLVKKALLKREKKQLQHRSKKNNKKNGPTVAAQDNVGPRPTLEDHLAEEVVHQEQDSNIQDDGWAHFNGTGFWRSTSQRHQQQPHLQSHDSHP
ncbi:uncharacterized protein LOC109817548 [Cajanus cajan]|uniref:Uncharacterized protein n=1 Tax=Cajanus cajan TaxID=3821 RepID=A0A151RM30_CAJCA|nr:uncharacterized protein LOC109817548 [Cajanus cajan]KYP43609.1 hypothetical protein KK1_034940 [Cajanus cajan]